MSDLQIVLIVIGSIIIAAVLIFNWWQERKFHQQVEKNFSAFNHVAKVAEPSIGDNDLQLDVNQFDDQDFAVSAHSLHVATDEQGNDKVHDKSVYDEKIDDLAQNATSKFENAIIETPAEFYTPALDTSVTTTLHTEGYEEPKSSKHDEIKAIIEGAFKNDALSKNANINASLSLEQTASIEDAESATSQSELPSLPDALHSQVDWFALLYLQNTTSVADVVSLLKSGFDGYDKPTFVHVQTQQGWQLFTDAALTAEYANLAITKISCAIQLADRAGPISRTALNRFQLAVESLGLDVNAQVEWQSTGDALNDANALDQFCIDVDKTMGFHLQHGENGAFTGTKLRGLAESQGLELSADGTFKYYDASVKSAVTSGAVSPLPTFVMFNRDHNPFSAEMLRSSVVKSVTFQLDIPHLKNATEAFDQMLSAAKQMETGLNAQLVDDNNRPLNKPQIEKIRHQLKIIQATMLTKGIAPGSDCAHRLFS